MGFSSWKWMALAGLWVLLEACGGGGISYTTELMPFRGKNGQFGYINMDGEVVINPQFAYALPFSEGLGAVNIGGTRKDGNIPQDGKWGFIDEQGRFIINPAYYSPPSEAYPWDLAGMAIALHEGYQFSEGLAAVYNGQYWIYIDVQCNIYINDPKIRSARKFKGGMANVYRDGYWGYIDTTYQTAGDEPTIAFEFLHPLDLDTSTNRIVAYHKSQEWVAFDKIETGPGTFRCQRVLPVHQLLSSFHHGFALAKPKLKREPETALQKRQLALVDMRGIFQLGCDSIVTNNCPNAFDKMGRYGHGLVPVLVGSKIGDLKNHPKPLGLTDNPGGKWGYADVNTGFLVFNPTFQGAKGFREGFAPVQKGGLWGYMAPDGSMITGYEFLWADYFYGGLAAVRLGPTHSDYLGRYAYLNRDGDVVWIEGPSN
ncbi:WG repeat-containing protein [Pontibacter sp. G13]|uniref:WG repeat-containing protein n=1 Tax=Pontibacter sp. G13 TaxID=3074898 RepID=UPI00288C4B4F|nr:WG repeat-containing protein [Pontibacter sp. G13]WNJ20409.1 WG repeat-containing protein [Pontibacter sp. G13]